MPRSVSTLMWLAESWLVSTRRALSLEVMMLSLLRLESGVAGPMPSSLYTSLTPSILRISLSIIDFASSLGTSPVIRMRRLKDVKLAWDRFLYWAGTWLLAFHSIVSSSVCVPVERRSWADITLAAAAVLSRAASTQ